MMENMRRQGASFVIYIIFGALIAAFVINFGPQSQGSAGCGSGSTEGYLTVGKEDISRAHFAYAKTISNNRVPLALSGLTRRELLAQAAESRGIRVSGHMVDDELKAGNLYFGGHLFPQYKSALVDEVDGVEYFDFNKLKGLAVNGLQMSVGQLKSIQARELQAKMMADILRGEVRASRSEAFDEFVYEGTTASFEAVKFGSAEYAAAMKLTDADVARFAQTHDVDVKAKFTADERAYKGVKPQLLLRQIFVAKAAVAPDAAAPDAAAPDAAAVPETAAATTNTDPGLAALTTARADLVAKKTTFAALAGTLNSDEVARANQGNLGYRTAESPALGDSKLSDAVKAMKPGDLSEVITTDKGFYLLTAEATREGDLNYDQVKLEIAANMARTVWSKEAARQAAVAALAAARADGGKNLVDLYEAAPVRRDPGMGNEDILRLLQDPNTSPEIKEQIMEMIQNQMGGGEPTGRLDAPIPDGSYESGIVRASWTDSVIAVVPPDDAPTPAVPVMAPVTETLPRFGEIAAPKVLAVGPIPRTRGDIPGLGNSKEIIAQVFDKLSPGMLADQVFALDDGFVIVQMTDRQLPDTAEFDKSADARVRTMSQVRGQQYLDSWLDERCEKMVADKKLSASKALLRTQDEEGRLIETPFAPCSFDGLQQLLPY